MQQICKTSSSLIPISLIFVSGISINSSDDASVVSVLVISTVLFFVFWLGPRMKERREAIVFFFLECALFCVWVFGKAHLTFHIDVGFTISWC